MHALVDSEEDPNEVDGVREGSYVQVQDASASHHGEIGYVCKVHRIRVGHHHSALVTFDDLDDHTESSLEPVVLDHAGKHKTDITSTMRTTLYRIDQLVPTKSAQQVLIVDPSSKHYKEIGNVVHWEESESLYTVVFKSDSIAKPASTFHVKQVEVGMSELEQTLQQTHPSQYEFECYALFTVVEMLRSAILAINFQEGSSSRTSAGDLKQIEAIVQNQAMWEWFTERIGHTDVVRNGQNIPS
jgi:hypothetical protein